MAKKPTICPTCKGVGTITSDAPLFVEIPEKLLHIIAQDQGLVISNLVELKKFLTDNFEQTASDAEGEPNAFYALLKTMIIEAKDEETGVSLAETTDGVDEED